MAHSSIPIAAPYRSAWPGPARSASRGLKPAERHTNSSRTKKLVTCSTRCGSAFVARTSVASAMTTQDRFGFAEGDRLAVGPDSDVTGDSAEFGPVDS